MALNTLHVSTSSSWGGREIYSCTVMSELKKAGCGVHAVCRPGSMVEKALNEQEIPCIHVPTSAKVSFSAINRINAFVLQNHIDVVHVHYSRDVWNTALALMGNRKPKLFFSNYSGRRKKRDVLHRIIYSRLNGVFTSSAMLAGRLSQVYPVPASKIHLLPYGRRIENYQVDEHKRAEIRARYGVQENDILIGTMVRIDPGKGPFDLVKSLRYMEREVRDQLKIMIVGEPTRSAGEKTNQPEFMPECEIYLNKINEFIESHGIRETVILTGYQKDLAGYLGAMDIFVFPSYNELYSLSVLDAMCMRLPVVATRAGGNLEQIRENENGLFYEAGNSSELAEKLAFYIQSPEIRAAHGENARRFVMERHDMDAMIQKLMGHYQF